MYLLASVVSWEIEKSGISRKSAQFRRSKDVCDTILWFYILFTVRNIGITRVLNLRTLSILLFPKNRKALRSTTVADHRWVSAGQEVELFYSIIFLTCSVLLRNTQNAFSCTQVLYVFTNNNESKRRFTRKYASFGGCSHASDTILCHCILFTATYLFLTRGRSCKA